MTPQREPDYYALLNLSDQATIDEIHEQFRRLVKIFHPDRNQGDAWCERQMMSYNVAYAMLSNPERKAAYDHKRASRATEADAFDAHFKRAASRSAAAPPPHWDFAARETPVADFTDEAPELHFSRKSAQAAQAAQAAAASGAGGDEPLFRNATTVSAGSVFTADTARPQALPPAPRREFKLRYAVALVLAFSLGVIAMHERNLTRQAGPPRPLEASALGDNPGALPAAAVALPSAYAGGDASSTAVLQAIDVKRHDDAVLLRQKMAPLWVRYTKVEPEARSAMARGDALLAAGSALHVTRTKLRGDISDMQVNLTEIQDQFDDLRYDSAPGSESQAALLDLDQKITSLERRSDPLYADL